MDKDQFSFDEMKGIYKILGEIATIKLPDISQTLGPSLLNAISEASALTASLSESTSWILKPDVLKPMTEALAWANNLQFQHVFDEMKRIVELPQHMDAIKGMATFARDFDWQWLTDLQTKYDGIQASTVEEIAPQVTEEETKQFCEEFNELVESTKQGVAVVEGKYKELTEKYPLLVAILWFILGLIFSKPATTINVSNIYEAPRSTSYVVYNTTVNQTINIIGNDSDYYNVFLVDPQTGTEYHGYIYKEDVSVNSPTIENSTEVNETAPLVNDEIESSQTEDDATAE